MSDVLQRRYRRLLRIYPATYRAERSDEIVDTLMQASAPGQRRPRARDAWALVAGGLRARAGVDRRDRIVMTVRASVRLGLLLFLADVAVYNLVNSYGSIARWVRYGSGQALLPPERSGLAIGVLAAATVLLLWHGRRVVGLVTGTLAAVVGLVNIPGVVHTSMAGLDRYIVPVAVLGLFAVTVRRGEQPLPRSWAWALVFVVLARDIWPAFQWSGPAWLTSTAMTLILGYTVPVILLAWLVIDARPAAGYAVFAVLSFTADLGGQFMFASVGFDGDVQSAWSVTATPHYVTGLGVFAVLALAGAVRLRRQAVL